MRVIGKPHYKVGAGAGASACNRKIALTRKPHRTSSITPLVCYTCMLMLYAGDVTLYLYANGM